MIDTFLQSLIKVLKYTGMWFPPRNYLRFPYLIYRCFQLLLQYSFLLSNIVYIGIVWGDLKHVSEASYVVFGLMTSCIKHTIFIIYHNRLRRLMEFMSNDVFDIENTVHEKILSIKSKEMCKLHRFLLTCGFVTCLEWALVPLLERSGPRKFPFTNTWMPVDISKSSSYVLGYLYQTLVIHIGIINYFTIDTMTAFMIIFAGAQLEISAAKIQEVQSVPPSDDLNQDYRIVLMKENNKLLNESIGRHQAVLRFVKLVENVFNMSIFIQLSGAIGVVCIVGLRIADESPNSGTFYSSLTYLVTTLAQIYLYSWCGSELTEKSEMLRDALYKCPWYEQDGKFRKTLWIAMEVMKKPLIFRAGYYIPLTRPTFVTIIQKLEVFHEAHPNEAHPDEAFH